VSHLTVASLNTRGVGPHLRTRYGVIGSVFETSHVDVVNLQEVLTYYHLHLLRRSMPSYRASFRLSAAGPAGGLVTFSRRAVTTTSYRRLSALLKGALVTRLADVTIVNTHLSANRDGDWSPTSRYYGLHQTQLTALARYVGAVEQPAVVCGDFNVARDSSLYRDFIRDSGLTDAFGNDCLPTFHQAFLGSGQSPHCIDYVLLSGPITVDSAELTFTDKLGEIYATDHLGLQVRLRRKVSE
jgi:endonuclease/exonuclease/phosphatase family metal-dependent hydrolase